MSDGRGPSAAELDQGRHLKWIYNMPFSKAREDSSRLLLSQAEAREALREVERVDKVTPNMAGFHLSEETAKKAMRGAKRDDEVAPNMILNQMILDHYHNVKMDGQDQGSPLINLLQELLGGGTWTGRWPGAGRPSTSTTRTRSVKRSSRCRHRNRCSRCQMQKGGLRQFNVSVPG